MACNDNFIGELQEQLQAWAPSLGCRPEELYRIEEQEHGEQAFRARVVLLSTTDAADNTGTRDMPWSHTSASKKPARQAAARAALDDLRASGARPHDPAHVPLAVPSSSGSGSGTGMVQGSDETAVLPHLSNELLRTRATVCTARQAGVYISADHAPGQKDGVFDVAFDAVLLDPARGEAEDGGSQIDLCASRAVPANLGALGEEFAAAWLAEQQWVAPGSVRWLNASSEHGHDHDIECEPLCHPARRHVEVKTRWWRCKAKMSSRQLQRLLDPQDDYMLVVVGDARMLFTTPPTPPRIRILTSPPPSVPNVPEPDATTTHQQTQRARKHSKKRGPLSKHSVPAAVDGEAMVDAVLCTTNTSGFGSGLGLSSGLSAVPPHVVDYVTGCAAGASGMNDVSRHWKMNRKRLCTYMSRLALELEETALDASSLPAQLATHVLLQLTAETAGQPKRESADDAAHTATCWCPIEAMSLEHESLRTGRPLPRIGKLS